jgi:hypothetical protein
VSGGGGGGGRGKNSIQARCKVEWVVEHGFLPDLVWHESPPFPMFSS